MADISSRLRTVGRWIIHTLCPTRCACCGKVIVPGEGLCLGCKEQLPWIGPDVCPSCGQMRSHCHCGRRTLTACHSPFFYEGVVRQGLLTLKKGSSSHGATYFGQQMALLVRQQYGDHFDGIVYVPLRRQKLRQRGYNQSRLLAKAMGSMLQLPVLDKALVKLYDTKEQHAEPYYRRRGNVLGVFQAREELVADKHLLLVDDIITTGATLDECAKMLLLAGCEEVKCVTAASTRLHEGAEEIPPTIIF